MSRDTKLTTKPGGPSDPLLCPTPLRGRGRLQGHHIPSHQNDKMPLRAGWVRLLSCISCYLLPLRRSSFASPFIPSFLHDSRLAAVMTWLDSSPSQNPPLNSRLLPPSLVQHSITVTIQLSHANLLRCLHFRCSMLCNRARRPIEGEDSGCFLSPLPRPVALGNPFIPLPPMPILILLRQGC